MQKFKTLKEYYNAIPPDPNHHVPPLGFISSTKIFNQHVHEWIYKVCHKKTLRKKTMIAGSETFGFITKPSHKRWFIADRYSTSKQGEPR